MSDVDDGSRAAGAPRALAVITGASAGIGRDLATLAAADGYDPVLVARRGDRLRALAAELESSHGASPRVVAADLTTAAGLDAVSAATAGAPVEVLVNNAGFGTWAPVAETDEAELADLVALNIDALTRLTRRYLPAMRARGTGYVLNVASVSAFLPGPGMAPYYASKAYVLSFSEALAVELDGSGIRVSCLCPGPTRTEFHDVAGMSGSRPAGLLRFMPSAEVARAGWRGMKRGSAVVVPGILNKITAALPRFLPRSAVARLVGRAQRRRSPS